MKPNLNNGYQKKAYDTLCALADETKFMRLSRGNSQREISRQTSISQAFISRFENHIFQTKVIYFMALLEANNLEVRFKEDTGDFAQISPF